MNNSNTKPRLTYIDIARGIAMLLVVIGHMNQFYRNNLGISNPKMLIFIYSFHMPLFFIISGMLFSEKAFKETSFTKFLVKKFKTLVVPYIFLDITGGFLNLIISSSLNLTTIKNIIINTLTLHCNVGATWFISALFIGEIILYFVLRYYHPIYKYIAFIPFLAINIFYPFSNHWINIIVRGIIGFIFMFLGYLLKEYFKSDTNKHWYIIIISLVITYKLSILNGQVDIWGSMIGNPFLCMASGLIGSYAIIGLSKNLNSKLLVYIGQNTMTMMGIHMAFIGLIWKLLSNSIFTIYSSLASNFIGAILFFIFVVISNLPIMYLYDKYIPFLIGKSNKKDSNKIKKNI